MRIWQDIDGADVWENRVQRFAAGKLALEKENPVRRRIAGWFSKPDDVPSDLWNARQLVNDYHGIPKDEEVHLQARINTLRALAATIRSCLHSTMEVPIEERQAMPKQGLLSFLISNWERAQNKAEYLAKLDEYYTSPRTLRKGFADPQTLLSHILDRKHRKGNLAQLHAGVWLEREDPMHRDYEFHVTNRNGKKKVGGIESVMSLCFANWAGGVYSGTITAPFFMWLETTPVCLADDETVVGAIPISPLEEYPLQNNSVHVVEYNDAEKGAGDNIFLLSFDNSVVKSTSINGLAATIEDEDAFGMGDLEQTFDTSTIVRSKVPFACAFVWTKAGEVFAARHKGGAFHHSCFVAGRKVQCAGMMKCKGGKVSYVDNNSGHYWPAADMLYRFVTHLQVEGVFTSNAIIHVYSRNPRINNKEYSVSDFLTKTGADTILI